MFNKTIILVLALLFIISVTCEAEKGPNCSTVQCLEVNPTQCELEGGIFIDSHPEIGLCCGRCLSGIFRQPDCSGAICADCIGTVPPGECCPICGGEES
ncbi:hypothetical protein PPL_03559 [Heterostelium album PN500]|uniref:Uncharacterized protein n=1 Tax=Heterostelium pallidum (strain ATCC 26659 / Pp 5 / PN500) TaxID=670386 RepID=D3B548_HETP5|nr:hypothetical protein PPL_03559 [Heterostelium album PN500]EFA83413.1 hypothetical protein PPL_03559 [Heterostelium album PN500]|eukprot:XP_020435530.1 hypothetical protein PPL_03559 [Heterostelium album PN500]